MDLPLWRIRDHKSYTCRVAPSYDFDSVSPMLNGRPMFCSKCCRWCCRLVVQGVYLNEGEIEMLLLFWNSVVDVQQSAQGEH